MTSTCLAAILCALALVSALVAGVFQTFSDFVMRGLGESEDGAGMIAMRQINVTVLRSWFLASLFLLIPGLLAAIWLSMGTSGPVGLLVMGATAVYILGVVAVTVFKNVPMNEALDRLVRSGDRVEALVYWQYYLKHWTRWNHLRSAAGAATAGLLLSAALVV